jgi:uncharacterized membrane protein
MMPHSSLLSLVLIIIILVIIFSHFNNNNNDADVEDNNKKIANIKILHEGYTADHFLNRMKPK